MKRLLCLLSALLMLFACGCGNKHECSHYYEAARTVNASCTEDGYIKYTCARCSHSYRSQLPQTGHSFKNGICQLCGAHEPSNEQTPSVPPDVGGNVGNLCPDFELSQYFEEGSLTSGQLRGKVTVINFWYVYCSACILELKTEFPELHKNYGDQIDIVVVHSYEEFGIDIPEWIEKNLPTDAGYMYCRDTEDDALFASYGGRDSWPITVILDENGIIQYKVMGSATYEELSEVIDGLLAK